MARVYLAIGVLSAPRDKTLGMQIRPTRRMVLIRPVERPKHTDSGLTIPESAYVDQPKLAIVESVGPGELVAPGLYMECHVRPGDRVVLYQNYLRCAWFPDGRELVDETDIIATVPVP